jgi:hypothetical protein
MSVIVASKPTSAELEAMESLALLQRTYPWWSKHISGGKQQVRLHGKVYINQNNIGRHK